MAIYNSLHISPSEQDISNTDKETATLADNNTNLSDIHILNINPAPLTAQSLPIRASSNTNLLAIQSNDSQISRGFDGLSAQKKYLINTIKAQPADTEKWLSLAKDLHHGEFVSVGNNLYNNAACYLQSLKIDPSSAAAWTGLSSVLEPDQELQINDQLLTQSECFTTGATLAKFQAAHSNAPLAQFFSQISQPQNLLSNKIELIPNTFEAITNVAQKSQLIDSLNIELGNAEKWEALAATMLPNEKVSVGRGSWTAKDCYAAAISNDSEMAQAWIGLGRLLSTKEKMAIDGKFVNQADCFKKADSIFRKKPDTGNTHQSDSGFFNSIRRPVINYHRVVCQSDADQRVSLVKALNHGFKNAENWFKAGAQLLPGEMISVGRGAFEADYCYKRALENNPKMAQAWIGLGRLLVPKEKVEIDHKSYTKAECLAEARKILAH